MIRALGLCGMGGGFLIISPDLRESVAGAILQGYNLLDAYSPYSYIGAAAAILLTMTVMILRSNAPR